MLMRLITKEILEHLMGLRFAIACILCFYVVMTCFFVRSKEFENARADYDYALLTQTLGTNEARGPWDYDNDRTVEREPNPLSVFVKGSQASSRSRFQFDDNDPISRVGKDVENASLLLFPSIDLVAFVGLILSLLAIVFGFDAICGEKQRGTLRLMLSYAVPRDRVLAAKWIGGFVTLIVPYVISIIAMLSLLFVQQRIALDGTQWMRLGGVFALSLIYLAAVYSLAILVSCMTARAATSIMLLVTVWVVLFLAIPNLSTPVARMISPSPPVRELQTQREKAAEEIYAEGRDEENRLRQQVGLNYEDYRSTDPAVVQAAMAKSRELEALLQDRRRQQALKILRAYHQIEEQDRARSGKQVALARWLMRASPYGCFASASAELAEEGIGSEARMIDQVKEHQIAMVNYYFDARAFYNDYQIKNNGRQPNPWSKYWTRKPPVFQFEPAKGNEFLQSVGIDAGILAGMTLIFMMLAYMKFLRYDVR